jgi:hypothetical protein
MTKFGETHNFNGRDFVSKLEGCINRPVDGIIYNTGKPEKNFLEKYREQKAEFVEINGNDEWLENRRLYASDILDVSGGIVRHNSKKLASLIGEIMFENSTHQ